MERRFSTRDFGLTVRMALTLACVLLLYAALAACLALLLAVVDRAWWPLVIGVAAVITAATALHFRSATGLALRAVSGRVVDSDSDPKLAEMLGRLAALADVPVPRLALADSEQPNAFSIGVRRRSATVAVTTALPSSLTDEELEAVLAHELAHIANRDAGVMTVATVPRTLGETIVSEESAIFYLWYPLWWIGLPIWLVGALLTLTLSRYREYAADRGAAVLTGRPAALMSALVKLSDAHDQIPDTDLRQLSAVQALCVVSRGSSRFTLFSDHPPLQKRLAHLAEIERQMGKPSVAERGRRGDR